jgi:hypothetical protein
MDLNVPLDVGTFKEIVDSKSQATSSRPECSSPPSNNEITESCLQVGAIVNLFLSDVEFEVVVQAYMVAKACTFTYHTVYLLLLRRR